MALNTVEPDDCCQPKLTKALHDGYAGATWDCPDCGMQWKQQLYKLDMGEGIVHWRQNPAIMLIE